MSDHTGLTEALRNGAQADMDGCFVKVSRQACEEGADLIETQADRIAALAAERDRLRAALKAHHEWHLAQDRDGGAWGIDPVDAYSESDLCEQTIAALGCTP